jgi:hypothetical protein
MSTRRTSVYALTSQKLFEDAKTEKDRWNSAISAAIERCSLVADPVEDGARATAPGSSPTTIHSLLNVEEPTGRCTRAELLKLVRSKDNPSEQLRTLVAEYEREVRSLDRQRAAALEGEERALMDKQRTAERAAVELETAQHRAERRLENTLEDSHIAIQVLLGARCESRDSVQRERVSVSRLRTTSQPPAAPLFCRKRVGAFRFAAVEGDRMRVARRRSALVRDVLGE